MLVGYIDRGSVTHEIVQRPVEIQTAHLRKRRFVINVILDANVFPIIVAESGTIDREGEAFDEDQMIFILRAHGMIEPVIKIEINSSAEFAGGPPRLV